MVGGSLGIGGATLGGIPEAAPKKKEDAKKPGEEVNLESPTSIKMKNSLLIKHADPSFDVMAQLKKRKSIYS